MKKNLKERKNMEIILILLKLKEDMLKRIILVDIFLN